MGFIGNHSISGPIVMGFHLNKGTFRYCASQRVKCTRVRKIQYRVRLSERHHLKIEERVVALYVCNEVMRRNGIVINSVWMFRMGL